MPLLFLCFTFKFIAKSPFYFSLSYVVKRFYGNFYFASFKLKDEKFVDF